MRTDDGPNKHGHHQLRGTEGSVLRVLQGRRIPVPTTPTPRTNMHRLLGPGTPRGCLPTSRGEQMLQVRQTRNSGPRARLQRKMCQLRWVASSHRPKVSGKTAGATQQGSRSSPAKPPTSSTTQASDGTVRTASEAICAVNQGRAPATQTTAEPQPNGSRGICVHHGSHTCGSSCDGTRTGAEPQEAEPKSP